MEKFLKKFWQSLSGLSLLHWIYTILPSLAGPIMAKLLSLEKEALVQLLLGFFALSVFLLVCFIRRNWLSNANSAINSPPARSGIVATESTIIISNGKIKNQTTSVDLTKSSLEADNLDIR